MNPETVSQPKPVKIKEPRVSCRVPRKMMTRLERVAKNNGIDISDVVRMALNRILPTYEKEITLEVAK
jgi:antitoxin component of RelBE/YafQ-DinJ toxin-antitoxin module